MKSPNIYICGAGGHGKVVADCISTSGLGAICGFIDNKVAVGTRVLDWHVLGDTAWLDDVAKHQGARVALAVGDNRIRADICAWCDQRGIPLVTAIHRAAVVASTAHIGDGTVVFAGAIVNADAKVGRGAIVNTAAVVEHDVHLDDFAHLSPHAVTGGSARIGAMCHLGLGSVLLPGICVGTHSIVGAGAVVAQDLPPKVVATGIPARPIRPLDSNGR